jgi:methylmalonyl-CoA mutase cobalamin-binding subunit
VLLGVETSPEQIVKAARSHGVHAVGLLVTHASDLAATAEQVRSLRSELPRKVGIWIGGAGGPQLELAPGVARVISAWTDLDAAIATLAGRG